MKRLLRTHSPADIAAARPATAGHLTVALTSLDGPPGVALGRALVRDLLSAGHSLESTAFAHDDAVAEILAEDMDPEWLACLGAVRHVWPVLPMDTTHLEAFGASSLDDDTHPGEAFFTCLRVARTPGRPDPLLHEARRRMKRLNPSLHGMFMRTPW